MTVSWTDIRAAERFELLATIREVREWRYSDCWPPPRLQPIQQAALALHEHLSRQRAIRGPSNERQPKEIT